jgi:hypothetical protein
MSDDLRKRWRKGSEVKNEHPHRRSGGGGGKVTARLLAAKSFAKSYNIMSFSKTKHGYDTAKAWNDFTAAQREPSWTLLCSRAKSR